MNMAEKKQKPKRSATQQLINAANKGLVADFIGGPVDLATMLINAPGQVYGAATGQAAPYEIKRPVGGSDWISGLLEDAGMAYDDGADTGALEDVARLGFGVLGPGGVAAGAKAAPRVLKKAAENLAAPRQLSRQAGAVMVVPEKLRGKTLKGLPDKVVVDGTEEIYTGFRPAQEAAERYMRDAGLSYSPPDTYVPVDVERARRIAAEYDRMPHAPNDPLVRKAYQQLAEETMGQYEAARRAGLKLDFMPEGVDPYGNPRNALKDIYQNNRMLVYPTESGFGSLGADVTGNPLLAKTGEKWGGKDVLVNDAFRAVHDYFGHAKQGVGFRAGGEENAWQQHASMFSPLARRALTSETRGQNSWLNYGPYGDRNRVANTAGTVFADQKTGLLPEWVSTEGYGGLSLPAYLLD